MKADIKFEIPAKYLIKVFTYDISSYHVFCSRTTKTYSLFYF